LDYVWLVSSTLRIAFDRFKRHIHNISGFVDLETGDTSGGIVTFITKPSMLDIPARVDARLSIIIKMCRIIEKLPTACHLAPDKYYSIL
jgi:hypothetical protein